MLLGFATVLIGTCVSCLAPYGGRTSAVVEYSGGVLVIFGLAMMGSQLRF